MKKLILIMALLASVTFSQEWVQAYSDTVANSTKDTIFVRLESSYSYKTDSVSISAIFLGEIDVDRLIVQKGVWNKDGDDTPDQALFGADKFLAIGTPDTTTLTVNNAAAAYTAGAYTPYSTGLSDLRGANIVRVIFEAASSGNDATDPNELRVFIAKYYTAMKQ